MNWNECRCFAAPISDNNNTHSNGQLRWTLSLSAMILFKTRNSLIDDDDLASDCFEQTTGFLESIHFDFPLPIGNCL